MYIYSLWIAENHEVRLECHVCMKTDWRLPVVVCSKLNTHFKPVFLIALSLLSAMPKLKTNVTKTAIGEGSREIAKGIFYLFIVPFIKVSC